MDTQAEPPLRCDGVSACAHAAVAPRSSTRYWIAARVMAIDDQIIAEVLRVIQTPLRRSGHLPVVGLGQSRTVSSPSSGPLAEVALLGIRAGRLDGRGVSRAGMVPSDEDADVGRLQQCRMPAAFLGAYRGNVGAMASTTQSRCTWTSESFSGPHSRNSLDSDDTHHGGRLLAPHRTPDVTAA